MSLASRQRDGIAILGADETAVLKALDDVVVGWAREVGGAEVLPPPLYPVADLAKFDVYTNFPHLSLVAARLRTDPPPSPRHGQFDGSDLGAGGLGLPTATCFGAYLLLEGRQVPDDLLITLANRCFRQEDHFDGLRRLLTFQMREVVAVGSHAHTQQHLAAFSTRIERFAKQLSLELAVVPAADPFFQRDGSRALLQRLGAVKNEFQVDGLAVSSVNTHHNFFGERACIRLATGEPAFTSCVAFGLERWLSVVLDRHGDAAGALAAIGEARAAVAVDRTG